MKKQRIRLVGQLIDGKPEVLAVSDNINVIDETVKEYQEVFPDMFFTADWGYYRPYLTYNQKQKISNLISVLQRPLPKLMQSLKR